jgi:hypothetical protein
MKSISLKPMWIRVKTYIKGHPGGHKMVAKKTRLGDHMVWFDWMEWLNGLDKDLIELK